ncbi:MAG: amino acid adenylation domain-containing protein, partial [bacterium]|nr:amino acid adenylation domain-containing protein [bacterium]
KHLTSYITGISQQEPDSIAISSEKREVSYRELEEKSNKIANYLFPRVKENKNIIILLEQSPEIIETIVATLKAGMVFVPVNPAFPANRVKLFLKETRAQWVVTSTQFYEKFNPLFREQAGDLNILLLDDGSEEHKGPLHIDFQTLNHTLDFPCVYNKHIYIYFTSGSTGVPNAVLGRHRCLEQFIRWEIKEFEINETFRISQFTNPSFDPFIKDIFVPLLSGATCCIPDTDTLLNPVKTLRWIQENQITLIHNVPSFFKMWTAAATPQDLFPKLKCVHISGELLKTNDIRKFFLEFHERIQFINLYGPTETTVIKLFHRIREQDLKRPIIPVGKPIHGARAMVINEDMKKCLTGNIGEVYIRSPFLSAGYYNSKEETRKKFVKNPFSDNPRDIIYKTGDLGRWLTDGNLELIGRSDEQVKISGVRIELGEIENKLQEYTDIKEAVVIPREHENGNKYLCAYIVAQIKQKISTLRHYLANQLPPYMIPSHYIFLDNIPLTTNGKVDKKALPEPSKEIETGVEYVPPGNEIEEK